MKTGRDGNGHIHQQVWQYNKSQLYSSPVDAAGRTIRLLPVKDVVHQFQYSEAGEPNSSLFLLTPQSASPLQSGAGNRFRLVPEVAAKQWISVFKAILWNPEMIFFFF